MSIFCEHDTLGNVFEHQLKQILCQLLFVLCICPKLNDLSYTRVSFTRLRKASLKLRKRTTIKAK
jgi:hypothetical protein